MTRKALSIHWKIRIHRSVHHGGNRQARGLGGCVVQHSAISSGPGSLERTRATHHTHTVSTSPPCPAQRQAGGGSWVGLTPTPSRNPSRTRSKAGRCSSPMRPRSRHWSGAQRRTASSPRLPFSGPQKSRNWAASISLSMALKMIPRSSGDRAFSNASWRLRMTGTTSSYRRGDPKVSGAPAGRADPRCRGPSGSARDPPTASRHGRSLRDRCP